MGRRSTSLSSRGRTGPAIALAACVAVLVAAPTAWVLNRSEGGDPVAIDSSAATDGTDPAADVAVDNSVASRPAQAPTAIAPALFSIPSLGIATEVRRVGVRSDGQVAIPADGDLVGWYRYSAGPGSLAGSTVIVGHRDTRAKGPGVFFSLGRMRVGDVVTIYREDWKRIDYRVVSVDSYRKTVLPLDDLFEATGAPRMTIITCGGAYVRGRGYDENVVVTAVPTRT